MEEALLTVKDLLKNKQYADLRLFLQDMEPYDISCILEEMPEEKLPLIFRILPKETAAETFVEMDSDLQELLISSFNDRELTEMLDELYVDDMVDIIEEMPANVVKRILKSSDAETRLLINGILQYPKDSAGSLMTTEYVRLRRKMTVGEAFVHIRRTGVDKETIYTCYVTDDDKRLQGLVTAKDLLLANEDDVIGDIMETKIIFATTLEDQESVAEKLQKYDFLALPVVDMEQRLVGIITIDDAIDVMEQEATEDIEKMAAIMPTDKPYTKMGVLETYRKRMPWLLVLMLSATFTSLIIEGFESALALVPILNAFIPMLTGTGGNAGGQASVAIIRSLSLKEIEYRDVPFIIWKEVRVAFCCGLTLGGVCFVKLLLEGKDVLTAGVVGITVACAVVMAKFVGCMLPIAAQRVGFDPAVMASPLITTVVDALTLLIYFEIASIAFGL